MVVAKCCCVVGKIAERKRAIAAINDRKVIGIIDPVQSTPIAIESSLVGARKIKTYVRCEFEILERRDVNEILSEQAVTLKFVAVVGQHSYRAIPITKQVGVQVVPVVVVTWLISEFAGRLVNRDGRRSEE